jgi:8-oxo-dGTP diphosphatase
MNVRPSALIVNDNKILCLKYLYNQTEVYNLPGGNLEFGEALKPALARELKEELNLNIEVGEMIAIAEIHLPEKSSLHLTFYCKIGDQTPVLNPKETSALAAEWVDIEKLVSMNLYPNIASKILSFFKNEDNKDVFLGEIKQAWF